jgi:hypothetical protein
MGTSVLWFTRFAGNLKVRLGGSVVHDGPMSTGLRTIKIGRISGVFYIFIDGVQVYTQSYSSSVSFSSTMVLINANTTPMIDRVYAIAYWSSYIADPNPIAGLNRREIVVTKTA